MIRKKLQEYYSDIDENKIRDRIFLETGIEMPPLTNAPKRRRHFIMPALSAAAVILITVIAARFSFSPEDMTVDDNSSENAVMNDAAFDETADGAETDSDMLFFPAEKGWAYSSVSLSQAQSFNYSDFDNSISPAFENNSSDDFFVEADILENTDFFLDCFIEKAVYDKRSDTVTYTVTPVHVICPENISLPKELQVISGRAYVMTPGREYLIPVYGDENGSYRVTDISAPQTMLTPEGYVIYQNGWKSLAEGESSYIRKDKASADDFFYDRMNITAESSLQGLFDSFWEIKEDH